MWEMIKDRRYEESAFHFKEEKTERDDHAIPKVMKLPQSFKKSTCL